MNENQLDLSWGVERRLEFIEFRLYWEGAVNRADITRHFGVSVPQASKDLSLYQELANDNMAYDKSEKHYYPVPSFEPRFLKPDPDQYLSHLRAVAEHTNPPDETWLSNIPDVDYLPIPRRHVDPGLLRSLLAAIRNHQAVEIQYQSMNPNRPDPVWRGISPHAFGSDGFRWHVRAYCHVDRKFKDFLLSRCLGYRGAGDAEARASDDNLWHDSIDVLLIPNPDLSEAQQRVIAEDFSMDNKELRLPVRKSLLYYFQKRLRLDVADALDNPQEVPVVVANKETFDKALAEAKA